MSNNKTDGNEMKGRNGERRKISSFILIVIILTLFLISIQNVLADDQVSLSFLPLRPNHPPVIHDDEHPTNNSVNVNLQVNCHITVSDEDNDSLNIYWYESSTGSWLLGHTDSLVPGGTYHWTYSQATDYSTIYYWWVVVDDGNNLPVEATYCFTTKPQPYHPPSPSPPPISNQPPIAKITGPNNAYANETMVFYATSSYDPDGNIVGYRWDFENDGIFDTDWMEDKLITYSYSCPGNHTLILQVKDDEDAIGMASHTINIMQLIFPLELPIPQINGPYYGYTNENITFNSTGTYDPDGAIVNYTWDFGDGNISYAENPIHSYANSGNYTIILKVTDNDNLSNLTTTKAIILDREIKKPEERELPLTFLLFLIIAIIIAIAIALLFLPKGYQITVLIEKDDSNKNEDENVESKVDELLSESYENKGNSNKEH